MLNIAGAIKKVTLKSIIDESDLLKKTAIIE